MRLELSPEDKLKFWKTVCVVQTTQTIIILLNLGNLIIFKINTLWSLLELCEEHGYEKQLKEEILSI